MILARILLAPFYLTALVLDKAITFLYPREDQIIVGARGDVPPYVGRATVPSDAYADWALDTAAQVHDKDFRLWEADINAKETNS